MTAINENKMDISWQELYKDVPTMLQADEKTVPMMISELDRPVEYSTMKRQVKLWVAEGKLVSVGKRIDGNGKLSEAYKVVVK